MTQSSGPWSSGTQGGHSRVAAASGREGRKKGGKRRKQKAIAYERQLAPLMTREGKQKSGASRLKHNKPTGVREDREEKEEEVEKK